MLDIGTNTRDTYLEVHSQKGSLIQSKLNYINTKNQQILALTSFELESE